MRKNKKGSVVLGILFILIGLVFFATKIGWLPSDISNLLLSFPVIVVLFFSYLLVTTKRNHSFIWFIIIIGGVLAYSRAVSLYPNIAPFGLTANDINSFMGPILFLMLGLYFIFGRSKYKKQRTWDQLGSSDRKSKTSVNDTGYVVKNIVLGKVDHIFLDTDFAGGEINTVMGSALLDFRRVSLLGGVASLDLNVIMGDITLYIPEEWDVKIDLDVIMGDCKNNRYIAIENPNAQTLFIKGSVFLGNVKIL